jgi:predicted enzyme related to lactoylglutathione lyase
MSKPAVGTITWHDLTVPNADEIRRFYGEVVGWKSSGQDMGGYEDYNMNLPASEQTVTGICHNRGPNANIPPQWLMYITVADVDASAQRCQELGGKVLDGPRPLAGGRFCVIQDPAGAVAALFTP